MRAQLNPRLLVLVCVLAALACALALLTLRNAGASPSPAPPSERLTLRSTSRAQVDARKQAPPGTPAPSRQRRQVQRKPVVPASTRARRNALARGLPLPIANALGRNEVVVAAVFTPGAEVDGMAVSEASAGAALGGAGFVSVGVFDEAVAKTLAEKTDVLETPVVFVFRRPGNVAARLDGFADRQVVTQAVANAAP